MARTHRPRQLATLALTALAALALGACASDGYPNSTFHHTTEFNTAIDFLWDRLLLFGTIVFVLVEAFLIVTIVKFRQRPGSAQPKHVHGNTTLEIVWTAIPAVILFFIAVPTVQTIFKTQAKAVPGALQVEVIGHQWWWEFRYPEYGITTANELYIPVGRTVNFALTTKDVLHSFWIPRLGGKRDLISNHTNYLWFTAVDSMATVALNGSCNEYCGASHANMKFRAYTVTPADFAKWVAHQQTPAAFGAVAPAAPAAPPAVPATTAAASPSSGGQIATLGGGVMQVASTATASPTPAQTTAQAVAPAAPFVFPREKLEKYNAPTQPIPPGVRFDTRLRGDPARGQTAFLLGGCVGCHAIKGNPIAVGNIGPNLTHFGSRYTLAGAMYPNDTEHLAKWIKNARLLKPGSLMPTLGKGEIDPQTKQKVTGGLTDQQIADVVAYLQALQ